ncbi:hypothetical protein [Streptomyces albidoflavus]|uniref:hypothetical protein n=1 Tax=Streptomyces albidoflavus TaxID=1886 RepID=UPI0040577102
MIAPQVTANARAVRLPIRDTITAPLLDDLALAYAEDPEQVGLALIAHAAAVLCLDVATVSDDGLGLDRAVRAAEADRTREALLDELPVEHQLDPQYPPDTAIALAARLTQCAAHIRHRTTGSTRT